MIKLAAFADEAGSDLACQIGALRRNGIGLIEIRGVDGKNIADLTCGEAEACASRLNAAGIRVWSIGSPIGKIRLGGDVGAHMEKFRHVLKLAGIFGTDKIRMFSFYEAYGEGERVFALLTGMVETAAAAGVTLCHENEKAIYGDTLARVLEIRERVPGLHLIYDPANFIEAGEDPAVTLPALHGKCAYFHIKDAVAKTGEIVPAGYGDGRIAELIDRIPAEADTVLTVEPHLKVFEGYAQIDGTEMKNRFRFETNGAAFDAAVQALQKLLGDAGYKKTTGGYVKQ